MKTSELIKELNDSLERLGDLEVVIEYGDGLFSIDEYVGVCDETYPNNPTNKEFLILMTELTI